MALQDFIDQAPKATVVLAAVGALYILKQSWSFLYVLLSLFVLPGKSLSRFGPKGSWAVVTGASDGIGKEFALQLARKGFNIVLISRTQSKLEALAQEIESKNGSVKTKILAMDFTENKDSDYARIQQLVEDLDVSILINNVGQSHSIPVPFLETPHKEMTDIITINCLGTLRVTQTIAPKLVKRRKGLILTMASMGGATPTPLLATYSGSKAFLQFWSTAFASELKGSGVTVQLVQSYLVTSAMSKIRKTSVLIPAPRPFVQSTLAKIGLPGGAVGVPDTLTPYWSHGLAYWFFNKVLGIFNPILIQQNKVMHESIRKRALRKAEREAKKV
ncbi:NAD(P)-binding protein [Patellaria atrata CBS 101060]|uniref:Very-long-chain 3-oxoacyl-CoA reductase n=1 Tax=Patellaria atrata CBS 101060 TaxID=1346257 RepID=A0A9P4VN91_9PEZI|nr:NAD(P)-binding protein [Patellaria atrata CBS 101060]